VFAARQLMTESYMVFRVQPHLDVGYSFFVVDPPGTGDAALAVQFLGFIVILTGLLWNGRHFLSEQLKRMHCWVKTKRHFRTVKAD